MSQIREKAGANGSKPIGKRLRGLLELGSLVEAYPSHSMDTVKKAQGLGLVTVTEYMDARHAKCGEAEATACWYLLTVEGDGLKTQLAEGKVKIAPAQNDLQLERLLEQTCRTLFEGHGEPDKNFYFGDELTVLITRWVHEAACKLGLDKLPGNKSKFRLYERRGEGDGPLYGEVWAEVQMEIEDGGVGMIFWLGRGGSNFVLRGMVVGVELAVRAGARDYFERVLREYPRLLADICSYSSILEFSNPVGLDVQPKRGSALIEYIKSYFANEAASDDEEEFSFTFTAQDITTRYNINHSMVALLALYDAAGAALSDEDGDRLLTHHGTLMKRV